MPNPWTLVTGASGFIGSRLVRCLVERGERVRAFVRAGADLSPFRDLPTSHFALAFGDVTVEHTVYRALAGCHRLYHVAGSNKLWDRRSERILRPNVEGMRATLQAAKKRRLAKIVVTSSACTLGVSTTDEPMDENHVSNLADPDAYQLAKIQSEQIALEMARQGLPVVVVQPSYTAGAGDRRPSPFGALLLRYLTTSPAFGFPVTQGGVNVVDVDDVALGHVLAMERGKVNQRYLLGGDNLSFAELVETLHDLTGLAEPSHYSAASLVLGARLLELRAWFRNVAPLLTYKTARDYAGSYQFITNEKAESELGYTHRSAREALGRGIRWYLEKGYVSDKAARRVRLELNAV